MKERIEARCIVCGAKFLKVRNSRRGITCGKKSPNCSRIYLRIRTKIIAKIKREGKWIKEQSNVLNVVK